ncbi:hypothetical protein RDI58_019739 [Solanum bulbocastanum]|uniref:Uncharacterized protein n=1 Tax=Solanum bulbocastanum TaxID=147425 RepID=A0AAN8TC81_SOLBU
MCPPSTISNTVGAKPNPYHTHWIQQDQLILSRLISSLSEETLPIIIGMNTPEEVWDPLAATLSSLSNTRVLNLHIQLQNLKQDDLSITQYLQNPIEAEVVHIVAAVDVEEVHINELSPITISNGTPMTPILDVKFAMVAIIFPTLAINAKTTHPILLHT